MSMNQSFIDECKQIQQNATYSAEAHHRMARAYRMYGIWLQLIPAIVAAISSGLVAAGVTSNALLWLTVPAAAVAAIASVWNPQKSYQDNLSAAKSFTAIKHDARFLHEAQSISMADPEFRLAVQVLHNKYNDLIKVVPAADPKKFEEARKVVQSGIHQPDRDTDGSII
jgi:hypothetical protein